MRAIRHSCRSLSFRFRWTRFAADGSARVVSGWSSLTDTLGTADGPAAWSPVVQDGPRRLLYCVVIDALDASASDALWRAVAAIPYATTLRLLQPSPDVAWRAVLPLSTPIDLADPDDANAWASACAQARDELARDAGLADAVTVAVHASLNAPLVPGVCADFFDGLPVNVDGMRASRDSGTTIDFDGQLRLGDVTWNVSNEERKFLAALLWQLVGNERGWPSTRRPVPDTTALPVVNTGLGARTNADGTVQLVLGPLSWRITRDEAASLSVAFAERALP